MAKAFGNMSIMVQKNANAYPFAQTILVFLTKKGDTPIFFFFFFLTEIILNFLYNVTGMVQIECQGWNEHFFTSDVVKWKHFPHYCPFVRGIHRPLVILPKGPVIWIFVTFSLMKV